MRKVVNNLFFLLYICIFNTFSMNNNWTIVQNNFNVTTNNSSFPTTNGAYLQAERVRQQFPHLSSRELTSEFELACQKTCEYYNFAAQNLGTASCVCNVPIMQSFIEGYKVQDLAAFNRINQRTINQLLPVLYLRDGNLKLELNEYERYQVARILTDHLKIVQPSKYLNIVKDFYAKGNVEFAQILKEETTKGSWLKLQTVIKPYGLIYGFFSSMSFSGTMGDFKKVVQNNSFTMHLFQISTLAAENRFVEAEKIVAVYEQNQTSASAFKQYQAVTNLYDKSLDAYCNRVCAAYDVTNPTPKTIELIKKIPLCKTPQEVARLMYETLAHNQDDYIFVHNVEKMLNVQGLPRFFTYNEQVIKDISMASPITCEQIEDRLLLFDVACSRGRNQDEKKNFSTVAHYVEKACSDNPLSRCYSDLAHTTYDALRNPSAHEALLLKCEDFSVAAPSPEHETLQRRTVPLVANLINEIKRAQATNDPSLDVTNLKAELQNLNEQFQKAQLSPEAHDALAVTIARLNSELKTFSRAELHRSPSMEKLFRALGLDLLVSSKYGTQSYDELIKHSDISKQNAVNHKLMKHLKDVSLHAAFFKDDKYADFCKTHKKLVNAIDQLNKDFNVTLAQEGLIFAKDIVLALAEDNNWAIKEVAQCTVNTVMHPLDYCSRTVKGIAKTAIGIADLAKHTSMFGLSTKEEQLAYAQACNDSVHNFFNQWHQLTWQEKREFAAQLVVDVVLNKALGSLPKMLIKTTAFGEFAGTIKDGIGNIGNALSHGADISGGGAIALPFSKGLSAFGEAVQEIGTIAVEGVASTPAAVSIAANSNFDSLFDARNNGNKNSGDSKKPLPNDKTQERIVKREIYQPLTNKEARRIAQEWGYVEGKPDFNTHGKPAFKHPKSKEWISPDKDGHKGGVWKLSNYKGDRLGTLDKNGNIIAG